MARRGQQYPYKAPRLYPRQRRGERSPLVMDTITGKQYSSNFTVQGPFGPVDGRDSSALDTDVDQHDFTPDYGSPEQL